MALNPCLYFTGNAEEALECYRGALGGELQIHRYKDGPPGQPVDKGWEQKVMYGAVASPLGTVACMDAPPGRAGKPGNNFSISIKRTPRRRPRPLSPNSPKAARLPCR